MYGREGWNFGLSPAAGSTDALDHVLQGSTAFYLWLAFCHAGTRD